MNDDNIQRFRHQARQSGLLWVGGILVVAVGLVGMWLGGYQENFKKANKPSGSNELTADFLKSKQTTRTQGVEVGGTKVDESLVTGTQRQPLQFRAQPVEAAAVLAVLATGEQTVEERVRQLQGMRGISFSEEEREAALAFLSGKGLPEGMGRGSVDWLSDELLTALRLQEPPWDGLAGELAKVAFQPDTNPVVRDYIMQHLGHLWEQFGKRQEIETALWKALGTADETTPGSALIALSRGYERDQQQNGLQKARLEALELAKNPATSLAVRVTALSIAGDGGGKEVKQLAESLVKNETTPVILKKVAERMLK